MTEPTTQELLERIRRLEAGAAPGPPMEFDIDAQTVQVAGRDMTVYELKRNFEFL